MLTVGVTGGIACGKSLIGTLLKDGGIAVCESDQLGHTIIEPGTPAYCEIIEAFGDSVLDESGAIDRGELGRRVFSDSRERERLNAIVHPRVRQAWKAWLSDRPQDSEVAAVIVPLLYEVGAEGEFDVVICVSASEPTQMARLVDRGLSESDARFRIAAQMSTEEKAARADYNIQNDGTKESLEVKTLEVMDTILESRNGNEK
jgi:dephospho-CoA kinase